MSQRAAVYSSYRRLYRARAALFGADHVAMKESRVAVRQEYLKHDASPIQDVAHFQGLICMADEAAEMLLTGIVRGDLNKKSGNYGTFQKIVQPTPPAVPVDANCCKSHGLTHHLLHSLHTKEIKFKPEHIDANTGDSGQPPFVEPVTSEVVAKMERKPTEVTVESTKNSCQH